MTTKYRSSLVDLALFSLITLVFNGIIFLIFLGTTLFTSFYSSHAPAHLLLLSLLAPYIGLILCCALNLYLFRRRRAKLGGCCLMGIVNNFLAVPMVSTVYFASLTLIPGVDLGQVFPVSWTPWLFIVLVLVHPLIFLSVLGAGVASGVSFFYFKNRRRR